MTMKLQLDVFAFKERQRLYTSLRIPVFLVSHAWCARNSAVSWPRFHPKFVWWRKWHPQRPVRWEGSGKLHFQFHENPKENKNPLHSFTLNQLEWQCVDGFLWDMNGKTFSLRLSPLRVHFDDKFCSRLCCSVLPVKLRFILFPASPSNTSTLPPPPPNWASTINTDFSYTKIWYQTIPLR